MVFHFRSSSLPSSFNSLLLFSTLSINLHKPQWPLLSLLSRPFLTLPMIITSNFFQPLIFHHSLHYHSILPPFTTTITITTNITITITTHQHSTPPHLSLLTNTQNTTTIIIHLSPTATTTHHHSSTTTTCHHLLPPATNYHHLPPPATTCHHCHHLPQGDTDQSFFPFHRHPFSTYKGHTADVLDISWSKVCNDLSSL